MKHKNLLQNMWLAPLALGALLVACSDEDADDNSQLPDHGEEQDTGGEDATGTPDATDSPDTAEETPGPSTRCRYPASGELDYGIGFNRVVPDLAWEPAYFGDGRTFKFDLFDFHCSPEYEKYETLIVVISAVWCPNCPQTIEWVDKLGARLEEEGAMILFVEAQNAQGREANSELAQNHIGRYASLGNGVRVGDANGTPRNAIATSPWLVAFPSAFVIRKRDMRVIADSTRSNYLLPFVEIAMDPEADWSSPPPQIVPEMPANCGAEDEEASEPNNNPDQAAPLVPGTHSGGICTDSLDFYHIDIEGDWTLTLDFDPSLADLDIFVYDPETGESLMGDDGLPVGSFSANDTERFDWSGPTTVIINGYQGATERYTLTLTER